MNYKCDMFWWTNAKRIVKSLLYFALTAWDVEKFVIKKLMESLAFKFLTFNIISF